ncbi:NAD(P)H-dependent glycerol-3-phosphate dehydrogenase [Alkalihalobacterium chitinilyticum]|uniref:Glycerol-3-phosphate dehydrogenase [NAD(P)+] n=1 Tax=Alkalihalobacterium chitinilyticum TaxID=2980103 RepID=A0ABT5V906_9BACI|nr:NAD(P)H-dependent glycerol-3-phosphate dehydrogenase [Alkalihalobacterium chitinilyticum]MDE5411939.1 NAD(P)H-dependent glycerol-3-phosphate dehydrogenase [Alkalihalobacterium chitinilyticum]
MSKIAVLGAGSWGTALAMVLADNHHDVRMWARREDQVMEINEKHTNVKYLPDVDLPHNITAYTNIEPALKESEAILLVVPTKSMRTVMQAVKPYLKDGVPIIHASKGIEPSSSKRVSEVIAEELPAGFSNSIVVLSGPSHAEEVSKRQPTTVTVSSLDMNAAEQTQDLFMNQSFRVYTNADLIGVELGGALKNIIALCAGLTDGLGFGDNAKAALMTRGLAEITRLGIKLGANPLTFSGLSGLGDLIVTCTSVHSRNWRAGNMLGKGKSIDDVLDQMGMVVEGIRTTEAAYLLAQKVDVDMPITSALYEVLFNNKKPDDAVEELMGRVKKHEGEDFSGLLPNQNKEH